MSTAKTLMSSVHIKIVLFPAHQEPPFSVRGINNSTAVAFNVYRYNCPTVGQEIRKHNVVCWWGANLNQSSLCLRLQKAMAVLRRSLNLQSG